MNVDAKMVEAARALGSELGGCIFIGLLAIAFALLIRGK